MSGVYFEPAHTWQPEGLSMHQRFLLKPKEERAAIVNSLSPKEREALWYKWQFWARPSQLLPPQNVVQHRLGWKFWVNLAGRGYGKTRVAAETIRALVERREIERFAIIGPTYKDVLQTMIKGPSGIMGVFPKNGPIVARYIKQDSAVYFQKDGKTIATGLIYTGERPEQQRGPNLDFGWFDELGSFKYLKSVWELFVAALRHGRNPRAIFTTTPRANLLKVDGLLNHPRTVVTFGKSSDNRANLGDDYVDTLEGVYQDTEFADQELGGKLRLEDTGAVFRVMHLAKHRAPAETLRRNDAQTMVGDVPILKFAIVVDPSGSSQNTACECGIVVMGLGADNNAYLLADLSKRCSPEEWVGVAVRASQKWHGAKIVYEKNYGNEMVRDLCKQAARELGVQIETHGVQAQGTKMQRAMVAQPLVAKGRVRLVGYHGKLEEQLTTWTGTGASPDRLDAFVWGCIHFLLKAPVRQPTGIMF